MSLKNNDMYKCVRTSLEYRLFLYSFLYILYHWKWFWDGIVLFFFVTRSHLRSYVRTYVNNILLRHSCSDLKKLTIEHVHLLTLFMFAYQKNVKNEARKEKRRKKRLVRIREPTQKCEALVFFSLFPNIIHIYVCT